MEDTIYELIWQNADKSYDSKLVVLKNEAYDDFQNLQRDDIILVKLNTLINRGNSFSSIEWDTWVNPKFKSSLNKPMSNRDVNQYMDFLKQKKMKRQQYFGKDSLAEVRALIRKIIREVMEGEKQIEKYSIEQNHKGITTNVYVEFTDGSQEKFKTVRAAKEAYPALNNMEPELFDWED